MNLNNNLKNEMVDNIKNMTEDESDSIYILTEIRGE